MNQKENLWFFVGSFMVFAITWTSSSVILEYLKNRNQQFFKNSRTTQFNRRWKNGFWAASNPNLLLDTKLTRHSFVPGVWLVSKSRCIFRYLQPVHITFIFYLTTIHHPETTSTMFTPHFCRNDYPDYSQPLSVLNFEMKKGKISPWSG